jgi:hypothetical protein
VPCGTPRKCGLWRSLRSPFIVITYINDLGLPSKRKEGGKPCAFSFCPLRWREQTLVDRLDSLLVLHISTMFIYQRSNNLTVSKPGRTSLVQQERTAKRGDCPQFIKPPDFPQKMVPNYWRFQVRILAAASNIKYLEYVLLIIWPH